MCPKSPKEMGRLQRRLADGRLSRVHAGPGLLVLRDRVGAHLGFVIVFFVLGLRTGWMFAIGGAVHGLHDPRASSSPDASACAGSRFRTVCPMRSTC